MKSMKRALWLTILWISPLSAHDFFLFTTSFRVNPGDSLTAYVHVDDVFPGKPTRWNPQRITRLDLWRNGQKLPSLSSRILYDSTGARIPTQNQGLHILVLDWSSRLIELKADDFNTYLQSEGLDHILAERKLQNQYTLPGRERYSRYVKMLIDCQSSREDVTSVEAGQTIELIPLENPYHKNAGDSLRVRLMFREMPLVNALVSATSTGYSTTPDTYKQSARTNDDGVASFLLDTPGPWLIRTVHMLSLAGSTEADWESWWASLTFEVPSK